jgi:hypothetical protein
VGQVKGRLKKGQITQFWCDTMVGPRDGGFGFDQSKKYTDIENLNEICIQCQAGQHAKCLAKSKEIPRCECEHCIVFG